MAKPRAVECREFIRSVVEKAEAMGVPISVAVVGPEGNINGQDRRGGTSPKNDTTDPSAKAPINALYEKAGIKDRM